MFSNALCREITVCGSMEHLTKIELLFSKFKIQHFDRPSLFCLSEIIHIFIIIIPEEVQKLVEDHILSHLLDFHVRTNLSSIPVNSPRQGAQWSKSWKNQKPCPPLRCRADIPSDCIQMYRIREVMQIKENYSQWHLSTSRRRAFRENERRERSGISMSFNRNNNRRYNFCYRKHVMSIGNYCTNDYGVTDT